FGTGESSAELELGGFCIPRADKRAMWQESLGAIARMFVEVPFLGHEGKYFKMPVRNVVPKPVQKPHPPLWVACSRRETIHLAAQLGIGALTFAFVSPQEARSGSTTITRRSRMSASRSDTRSMRTSRSSPASCATTTPCGRTRWPTRG